MCIQFSNINKEILKLNEIYSKLQTELLKQQSSFRLVKENNTDYEKRNDNSIEGLESLYNFIAKDNKATAKIIFDKMNLLTEVIKFCVNYDIKLNDMINSFYYLELKQNNATKYKQENMSLDNKDIRIASNIFTTLDDWTVEQCNYIF